MFIGACKLQFVIHSLASSDIDTDMFIVPLLSMYEAVATRKNNTSILSFLMHPAYKLQLMPG
jgi:hypothetical protein